MPAAAAAAAGLLTVTEAEVRAVFVEAPGVAKPYGCARKPSWGSCLAVCLRPLRRRHESLPLGLPPGHGR
eukprot:306047-Chlamydomonas_euryale.AAC.1